MAASACGGRKFIGKALLCALAVVFALGAAPVSAMATGIEDSGVEVEGLAVEAVSVEGTGISDANGEGIDELVLGEGDRVDPGEAAEGETPQADAGDSETELAPAADGDLVASGTWGACSWSIDGAGELRIWPTDGASGQLADFGRNKAPWYEKRDSIRFVRLDQGVALPGDCSYMFADCAKLASVDSSGWDTSRVTDMGSMFHGCASLTALDVSHWDVSSVKYMGSSDWRYADRHGGMFHGCASLAALDVSRWDTSQVTGMGDMFHGCSSLAALDVSRWDTSRVTSMYNMLRDCSKLKSLDVSRWKTSQVRDMGWMFCGCASLAALDVSHWDTSSVTGMADMFHGCTSLAALDVSGWNTSRVTSMSGMFHGCASLAALDVSHWDTSSVTDMSGMFHGCSRLTSLGVSGWDTSQVTSMYDMFLNCASLATLDVSRWNTSRVTNMGYMFQGCKKLAPLDVSRWDTSHVTDMVHMFSDCVEFVSLDVSHWDTSRVTDMDLMFQRCVSCKSFDVSRWDITSVKTMRSMFEGCSDMTSIDLSSWDTSLVKDMGWMFNSCSLLTSITVGEKFDTDKAFPSKGSGTWWSVNEKRLYPLAEIKSSRNHVADTYWSNLFRDVTQNTSHCEDIIWLTTSGMSGGWEVLRGREFRPNANVKRGDMAAFLYYLAVRWKVLGASDSWEPNDSTMEKFGDVTEDTAHAEEIWWMAENGISTGWDVGGGKAEYRPNADVKRGDMAAFLVRLAKKAGRKGSGKVNKRVFLDVTSRTSHAEEIWWMAANGITTGWSVTGGKEFRPNSPVKRGDIAAFLRRLDSVK